MFSSTIFKQTLKQNWKLWAIFTALTAAIAAVFIAVFDPQLIKTLTDSIGDTEIADMAGDRLDDATSILGMLGENFYGGLLGAILPLIFVIMTANSLIASQVDRGSMAYTLSTPIKRTKVVFTQAIYMILSLFAMFAVVVGAGLAVAQISHSALWGNEYTDDVEAAATTLDVAPEDLNENLDQILEDPDALAAGAEERDVDTDVYATYLQLKTMDNAYVAAADELDVDADDVRSDPSVILNSDAATEAAADATGMNSATFSATLTEQLEQQAASADQAEQVQEQMLTGMSAAAEVLDMDAADVSSDLSVLKDNPDAMSAAVEASGMDEDTFTGLVNQEIASSEVSADAAVDFNVPQYLEINLGAFLLMVAYSGIAFMFSCIFNLSKNSLALGAGIPVASLIFYIMSGTSDSLEKLKYVSLNTLYSPTDIIHSGTFWPQFAILGATGLVLYGIGIKVFKEKDLPL